MNQSPADNLLALAPRTIVRDLRALFADRSQAEVEIKQTFQWDHEANERELTETLDRLRDAQTRDVQAAEEERAAAVKRIEATFEADEKAVQNAYKSDLESLFEKAMANKMATQKKLEEAVWLVESLYDASREQPRDEFEQAEKVLKSVLVESEKAEEEAERLLRRSRMGGVAGQAAPEVDETLIEADPQRALDDAMERVRWLLSELQTGRMFAFFRGPLVYVLALAVIGAAAALQSWRFGWQSEVGQLLPAAGIAAALVIVLLGGMYAMARSRAAGIWTSAMESLAIVRHAQKRCLENAAARRDQKSAELIATRDREMREAKDKFEPILAEIRKRRDHRLARIDEKYPARLKQLKAERDAALEAANAACTERTAAANDTFGRESTAAQDRAEECRREVRERYDRDWSDLESRWKTGMSRANDTVAALTSDNARYFPHWSDESWNGWRPPSEFAPAVRFGRLHIDLKSMPGGLPNDERLHVPGETEFDLPATLAFPDHCSMLVETKGEDGEAPTRILQTIMLRLLTCLPPGKVRLTILDPVGLGQNFAGLMHLADYNEAFVGGRIWTETRHIEQRLLDLTEHMENVIQKYLRNEYETIDQYNQQAGEIAEPYRFLVISDFPVNFSETAAKRLVSILQNGARCGVYTLIVRDLRQKLPQGIEESDLRRHNLTLALQESGFVWDDDDFRDLALSTDEPPSEEFITRVLHVVGRAALDSTRVEVPFEVIAPPPEKLWSLSTGECLRVALGRSGATKLQYLTLGVGTAQHALIAGKTGSGKSTLFHALITNLALWYSPDEVELYLVDFKKGVEFKTYATHRLPHMRAVAIESDREFGLSVLQRIDQELARRGELFRKAGVQDLASFRKAVSEEPMPRTLLIIDEFQELFTEDDRIAQDSAMLLDRLVRQGRAFGIHVILGSQTLGGAYSLARSTIGQMAVRIALQCSEADSYLIMSDDNAAARLLSRPGEAIYNDASGVLEGNSPFQVVWLPDERRERFLSQVQGKARDNGQISDRAYPAPIVFEGNVPADICGNRLLAELIDSPDWLGGPSPPRAWFGEAISIKDPTSAAWRRQSGNNLLVVGQHDEAALAMLSASLVALGAQCPPGESGSRFYILDGSTAETSFGAYIDELAKTVPHRVAVARVREAPDAIAEIADELSQRTAEDRTDAPPIFLLIYGAHRFRMLRQDDSFSFSMDDPEKPPSPDKLFATILREGPPLGIHAIVWCDSVSNVTRTLDRQTLRDFEQRILFQMSPADSSHMIDSPAAAKLGFHRAFFSAEEEGRLEKFRPYGLPPRPWLSDVREQLRRKAGVAV